MRRIVLLCKNVSEIKRAAALRSKHTRYHILLLLFLMRQSLFIRLNTVKLPS